MNPISTATTHPRPHQARRPPGSTSRSVFSAPLTCACLLLIGSGWLPASPASAANTAPTRGEVAEKKGDLKELRGQIESLKKGVAVAEGKRTGAADQLKEVEQEISATQRELHNLGNQRDKLETTLRDLGRQSHELQNRLGSQQTQLEMLVYRQYLQGKPDSLRLLLNGDDSSQMTRDLHYLAIIGRARSQLLDETENTLQRKQALAATTRLRAEELAGIETQQKEQHGKLLAQREQRKLVLGNISAKITEQRREIGNLQRDEKQLSQLLEKLARIAAQAEKAAQAERAERAARAAQAEKTAQAERAAKAAQRESTPRPTPRPPAERERPAPAAPINNENTPAAAPSGDFARRKGELRLPTRGMVSNRFGSARQEGSTWKGLFIRASAGNEVKAIAGGQVVFADWMRGFGNLMIVDHGGSYLSIYGNNEALLKRTGDSVRGGDTIASVGNSGGNPESGLYFELRHQGRPLDPLKWVNLK
jgi:septal ring factor EnvC (AmiA/AmiB activator)